MHNWFDNHLIQASILSIVGIAIGLGFFIHPLAALFFVFLEIILSWKFSQRLDQRKDVRGIMDNLNHKEKRIGETYIEIRQIRNEVVSVKKEIDEMKKKIFDSFGERGFDAIEKRVYDLEEKLEDIENSEELEDLKGDVKKIKDNLGIWP